MEFVCLGCLDETIWATFTPEQQQENMQRCFAYDDVLREEGHFNDGYALMPANMAVTVRTRAGQVTVTEGPFAETKEMLGGLLFLEAHDLNHAVALMSKHPGTEFGSFEIRPVHVEMNKLIRK
ncbi:MAG: dehydrogenase [Phycisphaeraceae bacterium]|nr:dehydrogenase [Phycisphaeraceae bacterium]